MFDFRPSHLFKGIRLLTRQWALLCGVAWGLFAVLGVSCSSGGVPTAVATCSATQPCPDNLVCVL